MADLLAAALLELWAEVGGAALFNTAAAISGNAALINTALVIGANYAHGADQRRRLRNQARDAFNTSLQDRQVMVRSGVAPRPVVYGRDKISGPVVYAQSTGTKSEFLHLVIALAGHECDAIETIYFNDTALPAPDGSGFIQSGVFCKTVTDWVAEGTASSSIVLAHTPSRIISVTQADGVGEGPQVVELALTTGYTIAGSTVTFIPPTDPARFFTVNYEFTVTTPRVRVKTHLGGAGQVADTDLVSESGGKWTSAHDGVGICYLYVRLEYDTDIFGQIGIPNVSVVLRGKKVFDPRTGTTVWSNNAHLCLRDHLRDATYGLGCTAAEVPDAEAITGANICDEEVTLYQAGTVTVTNGSPNVTGSGTAWLSKCYPGLLFVSTSGTRHTVLSVTDNTHLVLTTNYTGSTLSGQAYTLRQRRYTVNGSLGTEAAPRENLATLVAAMAGTAVWVQGRWLVRAGAYVTPVLDLDEDYLGGDGVSIVAKASRRDQFNRVSGTYLDSTALYVEKQYPPQANASYQTADGGLEMTRELTFALITDSYRAQRLAKIAMERARQAQTVRLTTSWRGYDLAPSDTVQLTLARYGWASKVYEVRSRRLTLGGGIEYTLIETVSGVWTWNLGDATLYNRNAATDLPDPFTAPPAITGLACDSGLAQNPYLGSSITVRGLVTWAASTDVFVQQGGSIELGWKLDSDTDWQTSAPLSGERTSEFILPLQPARLTIIRIRAVNAMGRKGPYAYELHNVAARSIYTARNLIDASSWVTGATGDQGVKGGSLFSAAGASGENSVLMDIDAPDGVRRPVWRGESIDAASSDNDGGFITGLVPIDSSKTYRFVVFVRPAGTRTGQYRLRPPSSSVADIATGTPSATSLMIDGARADLVAARWYMLAGYVVPSGFGTTPPSPSMGGVYDCATGQRVANATDFKWVAATTTTSMQATQFNCGVGDIHRLWGPRVEMCDGSEPSLDALLAMAKTGLTNNLQPDFESQYGLNGQFSNWALGATLPDGWANAGGTNSRETTITRTGPNAVRSVSATALAGIIFTVDFGGFPLAAGSYIEGTLDAYLVSHTSGGYPGLRVRCYTNAGLSTQRDTFVNLPNTTTGGWQTLPFKAAVNEGERIYGVRFGCFSSNSNFSGADGVSTVVFDSLVAKAVQPSGTGHVDNTVLGASRTATNTSTTVTEVMHVPDGFAFNNIVCADSAFTAAGDGTATVTYNGSVDASVAMLIQVSVQDANGTYGGDLTEHTVPASGTVAPSCTRQFALVAGVSYQFKAYMAKFAGGGSTVTARNNRLSIDVRYTKT